MAIHPTGGHAVYHDAEKNARNAARSHATTRQPGSDTKAEGKPGHGAGQEAGTLPRDAVDISPEARAAARAARAAARDAITYAIGSGYSSAGKDFYQVKQEIRTLFDVRSRESGVDFSTAGLGDVGEDRLWAVFGDITDRRALFAVSRDTTGLFTKIEKETMGNIKAMVRDEFEFDGIPREVITKDSQEFNELQLVKTKRRIDFHEQASPEEKATWEWVDVRAQYQRTYEASYERLAQIHAESGGRPESPLSGGGEGRWWRAEGARLFKAGPLPIATGDAAVDALIRTLVDSVKGQSGSLLDSPIYARSRAKFFALLNSGHEFTYKTPATPSDTSPATPSGTSPDVLPGAASAQTISADTSPALVAPKR